VFRLFERISAGVFEEGPVVATADSLFFGFGFEGIATQSARTEVMSRAMDFLLH
jgi:hypothetical protein